MKKIFNKFKSIYTFAYEWIFKHTQSSIKVEETKELTKDELYKLEFKAKYGIDIERINRIMCIVDDTHLHTQISMIELILINF